MFEVSSDIYFVVYNLYYVDQNNDLGIRARPINRDEGSSKDIKCCMAPDTQMEGLWRPVYAMQRNLPVSIYQL
jgi:hypothetical protein